MPGDRSRGLLPPTGNLPRQCLADLAECEPVRRASARRTPSRYSHESTADHYQSTADSIQSTTQWTSSASVRVGGTTR